MFKGYLTRYNDQLVPMLFRICCLHYYRIQLIEVGICECKSHSAKRALCWNDIEELVVGVARNTRQNIFSFMFKIGLPLLMPYGYTKILDQICENTIRSRYIVVYYCPNNSRKAPIARPLGWGMVVFRECLVQPKFYPRINCVACSILLYLPRYIESL